MTPNYSPARFLYVFPHPDDESFGPALAISRQRREGHEVHLLTLTRGGATKRRHALGLSVQEMGATRAREMECVRETLDLSSFVLHDLPDGELKHQNPLGLEELVEEAVRRVRPHVIVTYAVHGVSGFPDHLVTHAVVKRVFASLRAEREIEDLRRLALFTLQPTDEPDSLFQLQTSSPEEIGVLVPVEDHDLERARKALDCYVTYKPVIDAAKPLERVGRSVAFELFGESFTPPLESLSDRLPE